MVLTGSRIEHCNISDMQSDCDRSHDFFPGMAVDKKEGYRLHSLYPMNRKDLLLDVGHHPLGLL